MSARLAKSNQPNRRRRLVVAGGQIGRCAATLRRSLCSNAVSISARSPAYTYNAECDFESWGASELENFLVDQIFIFSILKVTFIMHDLSTASVVCLSVLYDYMTTWYNDQMGVFVNLQVFSEYQSLI